MSAAIRPPMVDPFSLFIAAHYFKEEMTCFKLHRKLQYHKQNRFLDLAKSCLDFREAVFDHIFDHNQVWSTWKQWRREF